MTVSILLKSWAMPPASTPMDFQPGYPLLIFFETLAVGDITDIALNYFITVYPIFV
jgi:hypothetical protein